MTGGPIVNLDQAERWDGEEGDHWVAHQQRYEALTNGFTLPMLNAAEIGESDHVLDIGCGCGQTTRLAARRAPQGRAMGVDLSGPMLRRGAEDAAEEGLANVTFERGDAQVHPFSPQSFDVAISRFGIMFFADPVAAFSNIAGALRPGGRLAVLCWQDALANEWLAVPASGALEHVPLPELASSDEPGPFSLADPARVTRVLTGGGFVDIQLDPVETSMRLGDDADDATEFLRGTGIARELLKDVDEATAARALDAVREALRPHEKPGGITLNGRAWLVTARTGRN